MPVKLLTTLKKLESVSEANRVILHDFHQYMLSKDLRSEHHITNSLILLISLDKFLCKDGPDIPFTSINRKDQILIFLNHRYRSTVNGLSENTMLRESISKVSISI